MHWIKRKPLLIGPPESRRMPCPHCGVHFAGDFSTETIASSIGDLIYAVLETACAACGDPVVLMVRGEGNWDYSKLVGIEEAEEAVLYPKFPSRPVPSEVPERFAVGYLEASHVIEISTHASAALSRRCLQRLLREQVEVKPGRLVDEITEAVTLGKLPATLADDLHALRTIGNFAAHPEKDSSTGEILPTEPGEAEWTLDILAALFDVLFVAPARANARHATLEAKRQAAKKPHVA